MVEAFSSELFGSQIMGATDRRVDRSQSRLHIDVAREKRQSEIGDLHHLEPGRQLESRGRLHEEQIGRFDVPVDDLGRCRVRESGGRLPNKPPGDRFAKRSVQLDLALDVESFDQFHDEIQTSCVAAEVVSGHDIRMPEPRHSHCLLLEPRKGRRVVHLSDGHGFDSDDAVEALLSRPKDHSHSAPPDPFQDGIAGSNLLRMQQRFDDVSLHSVEQSLAQRQVACRKIGRATLDFESLASVMIQESQLARDRKKIALRP